MRRMSGKRAMPPLADALSVPASAAPGGWSPNAIVIVPLKPERLAVGVQRGELDRRRNRRARGGGGRLHGECEAARGGQDLQLDGHVQLRDARVLRDNHDRVAIDAVRQPCGIECQPQRVGGAG